MELDCVYQISALSDLFFYLYEPAYVKMILIRHIGEQ